MKNKKGFTLIELMGVITILVILAIIIVPIIDKNVKKTKDEMYKVQLDNIRIAGIQYFSDNDDLVPTNGNYSFVKLDVLIENEYISDVKNPKTGNNFGDDIYVQLYNSSGKLEYSVCPLEEGCTGYSNDDLNSGDFLKVRDVNPGVICGNGEVEDYYGNNICYINSIEDLVAFSNLVNDYYTFTNKSIYLMYSLDFENYKSYMDPNTKVFGDVNKDGVISTLFEELSSKNSYGFPTIGNDVTEFLGTFNGNGNRINNVYINNPNQQRTALFGFNGGTIIGLIVENITVNGNNYTGGLVGYNAGKIQSVRISGNVSGKTMVGFVAGYSYNGNIIDVLVDGNINSTGIVGGFVGRNNGSYISGVYRSGSVTTISSSGYANKVVGEPNGTSINAISLDSIIVTTSNGSSAKTSTYLTSGDGFTVNEEAMKNVSTYEQVLDTYIGLDNNNDGYYFDYNENGEMELYNISKKALLITMSGSGTEVSPYVINNYEDLKQVSYDLSKHYKLNTDIDLSDKYPITLSSEANPFTGVFNGNGKRISNARILGVNNTGLFGYNKGIISYLRLSDVFVSGYGYVGILSGTNEGTLMGLWFDNIEVVGNDNYIAGVSGYNEGNIQSVRIKGNVSGKNIVGLVSGGTRNGNITQILADGDVNSTRIVGGLVGRNNDSYISGVYRSGSVTTTSSSGYTNKVVGESNGTSINAISLDSIIVTTSNGSSAQTSTYLNSGAGFTVNEEAIKNVSTYEQVLDTYIGLDNDNDGYYFDYNENGEMELYNINENPLIITMSGSGTEVSPYIINDYNELKQVSYGLDKYYMLNTDIDLSDKYPITLSSETNSFTGVFNGNGKRISNARILGVNTIGLFGDNSGTIEDLTLSNFMLSGHQNVGALIGNNSGDIKGIRIFDSSSLGNNSIGLLAGYNKGNIVNCLADGDVSGNTYVGIASGTNQSGNVNAIVSGNVVATNRYAAGIVGYNTGSGIVSGVYRDGSVIGSNGYAYKSVYNFSGSSNIIALNSILVNNSASTSTSLSNSTGYTVSSDVIENIMLEDNVLDTFIGGDNDLNGYYYDYNDLGELDVYSVARKPLNITMSGNGTEASPYIINNYEELKQASYDQNKFYSMNSDIDLYQKNPIALATSSNPFKGTFVGNGYTISNVYLYGIDSVGLFGKNSGTIKGLKLVDINSIGHQYVGGVVGYNQGSITDVMFEGNVNGYMYTGLAAGFNVGGTVKAIVRGSSFGTHRYISGIVGYNTSLGVVNGAFIKGDVIGASGYAYKAAYNASGTLKNISSAIILVNGSALTSTSLTSNVGKTYSEDALVTSLPYEEVGFNFSVTDPNVNEYIWYFDDYNNLTFKKN